MISKHYSASKSLNSQNKSQLVKWCNAKGAGRLIKMQ